MEELLVTKKPNDEILEKMKEKLVKELNAYIESKKPLIRQAVATEFASTILYNTKVAITHSLDPPWDRSGIAIITDEKFRLEDYDTLSDFLNEYNGNTTPSYESGCGFYHDTYSDSFGQIIFDMLCEYYGECFDKLMDDKSEALSIISQAYYPKSSSLDRDDLFEAYHEEVVAYGVTCEFEILEELGEIKAKELFKEGKFLAKRLGEGH